MFRNYVNESLDLNQYNQLMKKSPENQKYCIKNLWIQKNFMTEKQIVKNALII